MMASRWKIASTYEGATYTIKSIVRDRATARPRNSYRKVRPVKCAAENPITINHPAPRRLTPRRKPPAWFSKDARAEWLRVMPILAARNTITEADLPTLENYCTSIGTVRETQREINKHGLIVEFGSRPASAIPPFGIQNAAHDHGAPLRQ